MNIFSKIISTGIDSVVDSVADGLDGLFTSDEEKLIMRNKLEQIRSNAKLKQLELAQKQEAEISKRWISDNEHFITRLVRPLSFTGVLVLFGAVVLTDGNIGDFRVNPSYIPMIENVLITMVFAYFGSRGIEKTVKHVKGNGTGK